MLEIARMLTISTAHISKETATSFYPDVETGLMWNTMIGVYEKGEYGWLIYADADDINHPSVPADLAACLRLAHKHECSVLCLDCDGEVLEDLPVYDW